jgi:hypothetical protein
MRKAIEDPDVERALGLVHSGLDKAIQSPRNAEKLDEKTILPEFPSFRTLARVLAIEEYICLADGLVSRAIDVMRDGLRLGYVIQNETLISGLVGVSVDAIAVEQFARHFDQMSLGNCVQLTAFAQEWLKLPSPTESLLISENRAEHNTIEACRKDSERLRELMKLMQPKGPPTSLDDVAAVELSDYVDSNPGAMDGILRETLTLADSLCRAEIEELRKAPWQRKPMPRLEAGASMAHRFCALLTPAYSKAMEKFDTDRARIQLLGVHAAIRRYRWENNRLPASLADLKMASLTTDPFTGSPLLYKPTVDTYELSSAGPGAAGGTAGPISLPRKAQ